MTVTYSPPRPPAPILTAAEKFAHVPKTLASAELKRSRVEAQLVGLVAEEQAATALAAEFTRMVAARDALASKIDEVRQRLTLLEGSLEGGRASILHRIAHSGDEGHFFAQAAHMTTLAAMSGHIDRFLEIRRKELGVLETDLQAFAKVKGIEYPIK